MSKIYIQNELIENITPVRLNPYGDGSDELKLDNYIYNLKLSEAFYPAISLLEVTLRNRICNAIESLIYKNWLTQELNQQNILSSKEHQKLIETANKIKKSNKQITNDRLISETTLGFWIHLCTKPYKTKLWDKKGFFELVFPNYSNEGKLRNISPIQNDLSKILKLRNRIFHHEIIINGKISPVEHYQIILNLLHILSTAMNELLIDISRFKSIVKQKP